MFEVSSRLLVNKTNVKLKKMLDMILDHTENEKSIIANKLDN